MIPPETRPQTSAVLDTLVDTLGTAHVFIGDEALAVFASDLFYEGVPPCAVITPTTTQQLAGAVKGITASGLAVVPRGGGLSYSAGYVANLPDVVMIDTRHLNRIIEINTEDMFVTVETGVTWMALQQALKDTGLRTPFWGTGSGKYATVGGTLSQNGLNYGTGQYGLAAHSVLGLEVVTAEGMTITTGSGGNDQNPTPFLRHYGPDLTGLFIGDCGALGIKTKTTLQLIRQPEVTGYAAYEFASPDTFCRAISELARRQVISECFGFDPGFSRMRTTYAGVQDGLKLLGGVATAQESLGAGLKEAMKVAVSGQSYLENVGYSIHVTVDGRDKEDMASKLRIAERVLAKDGTSIEASVPKIMRGTPFPDPTIILGHNGERWIPMHGIVPHSRLQTLLHDLDRFMEAQADVIEQHGIIWGLTAVPAGPSAVLVEPNLYWQDSRSEMLESYLPQSYLKQKQSYDTDLEARATVRSLREGMIDVFRNLGATHMQIGRVYPYLESRSPDVRTLLLALKAQLDPHGRMNPGSLGL